MNVTKPEADLTGFIAELQTTLSSQRCLSKGPNLTQILSRATELLSQAAAISDARLPEDRFQQHVTNLTAVLTSLSQKSLDARLLKVCKMLTVASIIFTIATAVIIAVPLLAVSPWIVAAPVTLLLVNLVALKILSRKKSVANEQIQPIASMTKPMKFAGASAFAGKQFCRTNSEVHSQITSAKLRHNPKDLPGCIHGITIPHQVEIDTRREPFITVRFPNSQVSYESAGNEHGEKQLTEYFNNLSQQLSQLLGDNDPEKLKATFSNLITLHTPIAVAEELQHLVSALGEAVHVSAPHAPTSPRNTIIKLDHAQMLSHLHVLYKLRTGDNGSSAEAYVVGTLVRTIPLNVLQIPYTQIKQSDLIGVQCTARYSQIFSTVAEALAQMELAVKESMSVPG